MATVYLRGSRWWASRGSGPTRESTSLGPSVTTRAAAERAARAWEAERGAQAPGLSTLAHAIASFRDSKERTATASTCVYYRTHFTRIGKALDVTRPLATFTAADLRAYATARLEEVAPATVNKEIGTLRALWSYAIAQGMTRDNPAAALEFVREEDRKSLPCPRTILAQALAAARSERLVARKDRQRVYRLFGRALRVLWHTGMRFGELCRLKPEDMRWSTLTMRVVAERTKGGPRIVPMFRPIVRTLARLCAEGKPFVFATARGDSAYGALRQFRDDFIDRHPGLELCGYHSLRHAWATRTAGVLPARIRQAILGHATERMTEGTYTHRAEQDAREAAAILNQHGAARPR